jgi:hypothetical protein
VVTVSGWSFDRLWMKFVRSGRVATMLNDPESIESDSAIRSSVRCSVEVLEVVIRSSRLVYNLGFAS